MKIDCLMGTYGRNSMASEALACFLRQTLINSATLLIYNQHPTPLSFDHPRVRVVNESGRRASLRDIRQRMHELADPSADLIHWWDDDDLYLPWHLEDCVNNIGDSVAWRPLPSWVFRPPETYMRFSDHRFEGSWIFRADYLRRAPIDTHWGYSDHPVILQIEDAGLLATTELGDRTSYIYRWHDSQHVSAFASDGSPEAQEANIEMWRSRSTDVAPDGVLVPADLSPRWRQYLRGIRPQVAVEDWNFILSKLSLSPGEAEALIEETASDLDTIPTQSASIHFEVIGNEILVHNFRRGRTTHLNPAASIVFGLCDGSRTIRDIATAIKLYFPDAGSDLAADVISVVRRLREEDIFR